MAELLDERPRFDYDHYRILARHLGRARRARRARSRAMHCELLIPGLFAAARRRGAAGARAAARARPLRERRHRSSAGSLAAGRVRARRRAARRRRACAARRGRRARRRLLERAPTRYTCACCAIALILVPAAALRIRRGGSRRPCAKRSTAISAADSTLQVVDAERWVARFGRMSWHRRPLAARAAGRDVEPRGAAAARRAATLLNEAQMVLHAHPVNEAREARGEPAVNSVWLWGAGRAPRSKRTRWQSVSADDPVALGLARVAGARHRALPPRPPTWLERCRRTAAISSCSMRCARRSRSSETRRIPGAARRAGSATGSRRCSPPARRAHRHGHDPRARRRRVRRPSKPSAATCGASGAGRSRSSTTHEDRRAAVRRNRPPRAGRRRACIRCSRKIYAARRIRSAAELAIRPGALLPPHAAERRRAERRACSPMPSRRGKRLLIIADYDADGATACAVGMRALRAFGANVDYLVPGPLQARLRALARAGRSRRASESPICSSPSTTASPASKACARAKSLGIATLITDHHLPGAELPQADCIVESEPGRLRLPVQGARRRGRDVLRHAGPARRAADAETAFSRRNRTSARSPTWSRSAPSPTSCRSTPTTATWSRRG